MYWTIPKGSITLYLGLFYLFISITIYLDLFSIFERILQSIIPFTLMVYFMGFYHIICILTSQFEYKMKIYHFFYLFIETQLFCT